MCREIRRDTKHKVTDNNVQRRLGRADKIALEPRQPRIYTRYIAIATPFATGTFQLLVYDSVGCNAGVTATTSCCSSRARYIAVWVSTRSFIWWESLPLG